MKSLLHSPEVPMLSEKRLRDEVVFVQQEEAEPHSVH